MSWSPVWATGGGGCGKMGGGSVLWVGVGKRRKSGIMLSLQRRGSPLPCSLGARPTAQPSV